MKHQESLRDGVCRHAGREGEGNHSGCRAAVLSTQEMQPRGGKAGPSNRLLRKPHQFWMTVL
jgi:hypothetical protein